MSSKRILGIAGAAMMGTLAGTGAVHAVISVGSEGTTGAVTFAIETLRNDRNVPPSDGDGGPFYEVAAHTGSSAELDVNVPIKIVVPVSSSAVVTVDLENLVLTGSPPVTLGVTNTASPPVAITGATSSIISGGGRGDRQVRFQLSTDATNPIPATSRLVVELARLGVDPTQSGSVTVTATRLIEGVGITGTTALSDVVKTARALKVTTTPQMQTASVEDGFMKFVSGGDGVSTDQLAANVGHLQIGIATTTTPLYNAGRGDVASGTVTAITHIATNAEIVITGDTSFLADQGEGDDAKKLVYIDSQENCSSASPSSIQDTDDDNKLKASLSDFDGAGGYLCLKVDGETAIPTTEPYSAAITYTSAVVKSGTDDTRVAQFPPTASTETLGSIGRDGSSVSIGYLTTNQKYNQRLIMVNRSGSPVDYSMTFQTAEGTRAVPKAPASGTLPTGRTVLDVRDVVTFNNDGNGGHGSAEMTAVVGKTQFDVVTVTTTRSDGSTDTVAWETK